MLVLLCGTAFSGKSTVARALAPRLDAVVVSLDEINERRGLWGGDGIPVEEWIRTHEIASAEVREVLASGVSVIVDDTSTPRFVRDAWRSLAAEAAVEFLLVYLDVDHDVIRRMSGRQPGRPAPHGTSQYWSSTSLTSNRLRQMRTQYCLKT